MLPEEDGLVIVSVPVPLNASVVEVFASTDVLLITRMIRDDGMVNTSLGLVPASVTLPVEMLEGIAVPVGKTAYRVSPLAMPPEPVTKVADRIVRTMYPKIGVSV